MPSAVNEDFIFYINKLSADDISESVVIGLALLDAILWDRKESCETGLELDGATGETNENS